MQIVCLDLEGVLVPEIWIEFSRRAGLPELSKTTRDEPVSTRQACGANMPALPGLT